MLGLPRVINAGGAQSRLGGATLSPQVRAAMSEASTSYVEIEALHDRVGDRLAELTGNEAAWVSAGSAAAIMVAVAAVVAGDDPERAAALPRSRDRRDVAVWRGHLSGDLAGADEHHANGYLNSIAAGGGEVRVVDGPSEIRATDAAFLWFPGMFGHRDENATLLAYLASAHGLGVPVVVDAADQVPPRSTLTHFTIDLGADLAIFSGGKGIGGPTSSGLVVGTRDLVRACRTNSGTEHGAGRVAKVGREELMGLLAAVEELVARDEDAQYVDRLTVVRGWGAALSEFETSEDPRGHCGQRVPRLIVRVPSGRRECRDAVVSALWERPTRVAVLPAPDASVALSPQLLADGEAAEVLDAVLDCLERHDCDDCR